MTAASKASTIPALTVSQPWAWAIIAGHKRVENRTWQTHYRGPLVIHAAKGKSAYGYDSLAEHGLAAPADLPRGCIVGLVELLDVVPYAETPDLVDETFASGPWCWLFQGAQALDEPVPFRGGQRLWNAPRRLVRSLVL